MGEAFSGPVAGGAEGGKQKAAEEHLLKKGRDRDAEGEEQPGRQASLEELVDGSIGGAGEHEFIDYGERKA